MEYLLGKGIDRVMRLRHGRKLRKWKQGRDPVRVKDLERRFSLFASVITGRSTSVVAMHGDPPPRPYAPLLVRAGHPSQLGEHAFSWTDGDSIFLPVSSIHMEGPSDEEDLLKMSIFFHAFQMTAGTAATAFRNRHTLEADQELADLFWIIENKRLAALIRREYPLALERFSEMASALIEARPPMDWLRPSEARMEDFLRASVLDDAPLFSVRSATESLAMARAVLDQWRASSGRRALGDRYRAMVPFVLYGRLLPGRVKEEALLKDSRRDPDPDAPGDIINEKATEDAEKKRYVQKKEDVDEEANENGLALNIYDKFITWAEFVNVPRPFDDDPEDGLDKKADAMDEISTAQIDRSTNAFFNAELEKAETYTEDPAAAAAVEKHVFTYPEWNYRKKTYREGHATLREEEAEGEDSAFALSVLSERRGLVKTLRRQFEILNPELRPLKRQIDGSEIDIDAVVQAAGDRLAGTGPDERLYIREARAARDMSALFLVDQSMSTETWVGGKRVIEHEKEAILLLCESMKELRDRYAVYGFSGRNRTGCRYWRVKTFDEPYSVKVRDRLGALVPMGYTRMGPAIRHSVSLLEKESARVRLLFIVSDGKPNDMDEYEGRYGLEDTAVAIKEAKKAGITPFCLTVDHSAGEYLPRLFGRGHYVVLQDAKKLAESLPVLFARVVNGL